MVLFGPTAALRRTARFTELVKGPEDHLALDEAALLIAARGLPITSSVLGMELGRRIGLRLEGVSWVFDLRKVLPGADPLEGRDWARVLGATGRFVEAAEEIEALAPLLPQHEKSLFSEAFAFRSRLN